MNDQGKRNWWRIAIWLLIAMGVVAALWVAIPALLDSRKTASRDACLRNLRLIEEMKKAEQAPPQLQPVKIVSATSALLPEYRTERTNANHTSDGIRQPADVLPKPSR